VVPGTPIRDRRPCAWHTTCDACSPAEVLLESIAYRRGNFMRKWKDATSRAGEDGIVVANRGEAVPIQSTVSTQGAL